MLIFKVITVIVCILLSNRFECLFCEAHIQINHLSFYFLVAFIPYKWDQPLLFSPTESSSPSPFTHLLYNSSYLHLKPYPGIRAPPLNIFFNK